MRTLIAHNPKCRLVLRQMTILTAGAALVCAAYDGGPTVIRVHTRKSTFTPNKTTLERGVPVMFELTGQDILMGFSIPDFNMHADMVPGQIVRLAFTPNKASTFDSLYDIFYGFDHGTMNGTLVVT